MQPRVPPNDERSGPSRSLHIHAEDVMTISWPWGEREAAAGLAVVQGSRPGSPTQQVCNRSLVDGTVAIGRAYEDTPERAMTEEHVGAHVLPSTNLA